MKVKLLFLSTIGLLTSCSPALLPQNSYPQNVTETHTKTTLAAPPTYQMQQMPQAAFYQAQNPLQPQNNFQTQYQAVPVLPQYQNYQVSGIATPQYVVVQPLPQDQVLSLQAPKPLICDPK